MEEEKIVRKQLLKSMIFTFITFSIIFTVFDFIIYNQISTSIYNSIDKEISSAEEDTKTRGLTEKIDRISSNNTKNNIADVQLDTENNNSTDNSKKQFPPSTGNGKMGVGISPRLIYIIRDSDGNIMNQDSIGRFYDEYINDVSFDKNQLEEKYTIRLNDTYSYRGINFTTTGTNGEVIYVQVLANVDGETQTVKTTIKTLITTTIIMVALSIVASYILSKRTLKPIIESWHRQTEFVQNASHELRTPLTIIQAKQELLLQEPNKKIIDKSQDITVCLNETRRLSKLVKELMTLARADTNNLELNKEKVDIDHLIKEVSEPYAEMAQMQNKKIELDLNYARQANVDKNKIAELIIIILDNAIKYTTEGDKITVTTKIKDGKLVIEITDTGIGISKESLKHIFDRFYREDKARSRETGGNGLGLSIAQTIVLAHNGTIKLTQNNPKGTTVTIKI